MVKAPHATVVAIAPIPVKLKNFCTSAPIGLFNAFLKPAKNLSNPVFFIFSATWSSDKVCCVTEGVLLNGIFFSITSASSPSASYHCSVFFNLHAYFFSPLSKYNLKSYCGLVFISICSVSWFSDCSKINFLKFLNCESVNILMFSSFSKMRLFKFFLVYSKIFFFGYPIDFKLSSISF